MGSTQNTQRTPGGWFTVVYWLLVAVGVIAVVLAFTVGSAEQRIWTGAIVFIGVILLTTGQLLVRRQRRRNQR